MFIYLLDTVYYLVMPVKHNDTITEINMPSFSPTSAKKNVLTISNKQKPSTKDYTMSTQPRDKLAGVTVDRKYPGRITSAVSVVKPTGLPAQ